MIKKPTVNRTKNIKKPTVNRRFGSEASLPPDDPGSNPGDGINRYPPTSQNPAVGHEASFLDDVIEE